MNELILHFNAWSPHFNLFALAVHMLNTSQTLASLLLFKYVLWFIHTYLFFVSNKIHSSMQMFAFSVKMKPSDSLSAVK